MAHLIPYPFGRLLSRIMRELAAGGSVLDLPPAKFVRGPAGQDWSVVMHGARAATALGPAAGPHTQLAQNIVLAFLGGSRIFELKTVQIMDELAIPRPCIDMRTVGFNVEWSQELKLEQSLEEYVKASMLLEILVASGLLALEPGFERFLFDMSVGYDLKGIQSERVRAFLSGMQDASALVDRYRREIPIEYARFRDLPFRTRISEGITLSTFHGCPPDEIEGISRFLMEVIGVHCIVKLNPTLNEPVEARRILHDVLGYRYRIPDSAFSNDPTFQQAVDLVGRLEETSRKTGRGLGVKFSNTLVVENEGDFLPPSEKSSYLSGQPLHVLAMNLVGKFRGAFGDRLPISFSAGIDRKNFPDAVSLGLVPVTVCTDLLRPGGYGRSHGYFQELAERMTKMSATTVDDFVIRAHGRGEAALARVSGFDAATRARCRAALDSAGDLRAFAGARFGDWVSAARLENTTKYVESLFTDARYQADANAKPPKKVGSKLELFDCVTCDKCIPVCPNHANFSYVLPQVELPVVKLTRAADGTWTKRETAPLVIAKKRQFANFADFCNECGNCDIFCPEDGGPYIIKPRFFGSREQWTKWKSHDGFFITHDEVLGRFEGREFALLSRRGTSLFRGPSFELELDESRPNDPRAGRVDAGIEIDLTYFHILRWLRDTLLAGPITYVNA